IHRGAQSMAHVEGRTVRTGTDHPLDLQRADSLLAREHQIENVKPHAQRVFRILENRLDREREAIGISLAALWIRALPMPRLGNRVDVVLFAASRTDRAIRPAPRSEIDAASILIGKQALKLADCHLRRELRVMLIVLALLHEHRIAQSYLSVKCRILAS